MSKQSIHNINVADHLISQANLIYDIAKPLFRDYGLNYFSFAEITENGDYIWLNSDAKLYRDIVDNNFIDRGPRILLKNFPNRGHYFIEDQHYQTSVMRKLQDIVKVNNHQHNLMIMHPLVSNNKRVIHRCVFSTKNQEAAIELSKNPQIMYQFVQYFLARYQQFIDRSPRFALENSPNTEQYAKFWDNVFKVQETDEYQPQITSSLRASEKAVIHWYLKGKSANETAEILDCSRRTVEKHFENMRARFSVGSKQQLILKLLSQNLIDINQYL